MTAAQWEYYTPPRIGERRFYITVRRGRTLVQVWEDKRNRQHYADCAQCRWRWPEAGTASVQDTLYEATSHAEAHERRKATWYTVRDAQGTVAAPLSLSAAAEQVFTLLAQGLPGDRIVATVYVHDE